MAYRTSFLSLRMKLDELINDKNLEQKIIENIRYCRRIIGKEFKVYPDYPKGKPDELIGIEFDLERLGEDI